MNRKRLRAITSAARWVRNWAEENHHVFGHDKDMCGMCAIASGMLHLRLADRGISSTLILNELGFGSHVFLVVDNLVVDVTATQFEGFETADVVVMSRQQAADHEWWSGGVEIDNVKDLHQRQKEGRWPESQIVTI